MVFGDGPSTIAGDTIEGRQVLYGGPIGTKMITNSNIGKAGTNGLGDRILNKYAFNL